MERLLNLSGLGMPQGPPGKMEDVVMEKDTWTTLDRLLPPGLAEENGWMDFYTLNFTMLSCAIDFLNPLRLHFYQILIK